MLPNSYPVALSQVVYRFCLYCIEIRQARARALKQTNSWLLSVAALQISVEYPTGIIVGASSSVPVGCDQCDGFERCLSRQSRLDTPHEWPARVWLLHHRAEDLLLLLRSCVVVGRACLLGFQSMVPACLAAASFSSLTHLSHMHSPPSTSLSLALLTR
jgi:hypothetical protein